MAAKARKPTWRWLVHIATATKGPNIAGFDAETDQVVRLFNPRSHNWEQHFEVDGARMSGKTPIGRVTIDVLGMNSADQLLVRTALLKED
jgi:hypothetical protein